MNKQPPTMTPSEQLAAWRKDRSPGEGYVSAAAMGVAARKLSRAAMPPAELNDEEAGDGARRKIPMRYE